jgi:hypothetical protein
MKEFGFYFFKGVGRWQETLQIEWFKQFYSVLSAPPGHSVKHIQSTPLSRISTMMEVGNSNPLESA